jgi:sigma-B regulation protein RsbU (phosphoserine phosphatase)
VAVGDVSGKGPAAALLTAKIQGLFSAQLGEGTPAQTVRRVNAGLSRRAVEAKYATLFYATLTATGLLTYCNAGHNPPMLYGPGGLRRLDTSSVPVGFFEDAQYADVQEQMRQGDVLVIYSDGVTEALDVHGEEFGEDRLKAVLDQQRAAEATDILSAIVSAVQTFARGAAQHDDVTLLVVKYVG